MHPTAAPSTSGPTTAAANDAADPAAAVANPAPSAGDDGEATSGCGRFYFADGSTYDGEWRVAGLAPPAAAGDAAPPGGSGDRVPAGVKKGAGRPAGGGEKAGEKAAADKAPPAAAAAACASPAGAAVGAAQQPQQPPRRVRHGKGTFRDGGNTFTGEWRDDALDGTARAEYASGAVYEGGWRAGRYEGAGTYAWPGGGGRRYEGEWRGGVMHGDGAYTDAAGRRWAGRFHNGSGPGLTRDLLGGG